jgi:hypothetical protein
VLDPITGKPCLDKVTGRPYIVGPDGRPVVAPAVTPSPAERVARLEDAVVNLAAFVTESQRSRFVRSLGGAIGGVGPKVLAFVETIEAERAAARKD